MCSVPRAGAGGQEPAVAAPSTRVRWGERKERHAGWATPLLSGVLHPTPRALVTLSPPHLYDFCCRQNEVFTVHGMLQAYST